MKKFLAIMLFLLLLTACGKPSEAPAAPPAPEPETVTPAEPVMETEPEPAPEPEPIPEPEPFPEPVPAPVELTLDGARADLGLEEGYYYIQNAEDRYLAYDDMALALSDEPQLWYFRYKEEGGCQILEADEGLLMLDVSNAWYEPGNTVGVFGDTGYLAQHWTFALGEDGLGRIRTLEHPELALAESDGVFTLQEEGAGWRFWSVTPDVDQNLKQSMAYNVYSDPVLPPWCERYDAFTIDFQTNRQGLCTYWALCNWYMDLSDFPYDCETFGCYGGLQSTLDGTTAIMAIWELNYVDETGTPQIHNATRIYPEGEESYFGGEGEGVNFITPFPWEESHWYRMVFHCWDDPETGRTLVGEWVIDLETAETTLITCFDTGLIGSCFNGSPSQFMVNYDFITFDEERDFRYKNMYARPVGSFSWEALKTSVLSINTWGNGRGDFDFGAEEDYFWGCACGRGADKLPTASAEEIMSTFTIRQPAQPDPSIDLKALRAMVP